MCTAPCETEVAPGTRRLALSLGKGTPVEPENFVRIEGPSRLEGEYTSYAGMRLAGWLTMVGSAGVGTYLMLTSLSADETCDSSGYCTETLDSTRLYAGAGVMLAGGIVGLVLSGKSDEAQIRVVPMSTATTDGSYKSASVGELVLPTGGAISGQF